MLYLNQEQLEETEDQIVRYGSEGTLEDLESVVFYLSAIYGQLNYIEDQGVDSAEFDDEVVSILEDARDRLERVLSRSEEM